MKLLLRALALLVLLLPQVALRAAGPRWVAGRQWINNGKPMSWYRPDVQYFVDAGDLSASVDHAAAVALVESAASVWNVSGVNFSLTNGGTLAEDVSGANVYPGSAGLVWPADVDSGNYTARQIAVVFDSDGSILDTLLGAGASAPANCRQQGVLESVDKFIQPGKIAHALIVVNGRCTGTAPEQQLQLRYQLMRVFGRVIGLGWSQTNDNVFTGSPAPSYAQQMHWPIMHPIDILCGAYTYQCLPQPFSLREDDIASLAMLYAENVNAGVTEKVTTIGWITFPGGQGMSGVHVAATRNYPWAGYGTEPYEVVSTVSGFLAHTETGNPVTGPGSDTATVYGSDAGWAPGYFMLYGIPLLTQFEFTNVLVGTAPVNPLYTGPYAVGPYRAAQVAPSGSAQNVSAGAAGSGYYQSVGSLAVQDAASQCNGSADGTEDAPSAQPPAGIWGGRLCGIGHAAWSVFSVRAGRTATVEVTATDESGAATISKAMPLIGLWHGSGATGTLPTVAATAAAFNSLHAGTTQLRASFTADETVRMVVVDSRGDGRPDYTYSARLLYADTVTPARLPPAGGNLHITGTGFRQGSVVLVGGVVARVVSVSSNAIDAVAPALSALGGTTANDLTVRDPSTGASAVISNAVTYEGASADGIAWLTLPPSTAATGAALRLAWRVADSAGAAVANATVDLASSGPATFAACGLSSCTLVTDSSGIATTTVTASSAGTVALTATLHNGAVARATFEAQMSGPAVSMVRPVQYVAAGAGTLFHPAANVLSAGAAMAAQWSASSPRVALGAFSSEGTVTTVAATGSLRDGEHAVVQLCLFASACASESVIGVAAADLRVSPVSGDLQSLPASQSLLSVTVRVVDAAGHPVAGAAVAVHQQVTGWQPPCAVSRCPSPPVYGQSTTTGSTDDDGLLTFPPLQVAETAGRTQVTVTAGTEGALTLILEKTP